MKDIKKIIYLGCILQTFVIVTALPVKKLSCYLMVEDTRSGLFSRTKSITDLYDVTQKFSHPSCFTTDLYLKIDEETTNANSFLKILRSLNLLNTYKPCNVFKVSGEECFFTLKPTLLFTLSKYADKKGKTELADRLSEKGKKLLTEMAAGEFFHTQANPDNLAVRRTYRSLDQIKAEIENIDNSQDAVAAYITSLEKLHLFNMKKYSPIVHDHVQGQLLNLVEKTTIISELLLHAQKCGKTNLADALHSLLNSMIL